MTLFLDSPALLPPFKRGHSATLERVYRHYVRGVFAMACRAMNLQPRHQALSGTEASDVVSETFIRAFAEPARQAYDGNRPYRPYLLTIGRNVLRKLALAGQRNVRLDDNDDIDGGDAISDAINREPYEHPSIVAATEQFIQTLKEPERSVHRLRFSEGFGQDDTARQLGLSRQQVRTLETKLRQSLRQHLVRLQLIEEESA